jgi:hypothetical protein
LDSHDLAWAAGFFDGEGWANRKERGVQSRINQADPKGVPEVLLKFQRIVGVGRIKGPMTEEGKQPLYYWEATSRPDIGRVGELIGPWLCSVERIQFEATLGTSLATPAWPGSRSEELAWAGGFFDGEGSTYLEKHRTHAGYCVPVLNVTQSSDAGIAPTLLRFRSAVGNRGRISGPRQDRPDQTPYRRWRAWARRDVELIVHQLSPFIGPVKRAQAIAAISVAHSQPDLPRGNPAFGAAGAR